ncbi:MAG: hypothetical protein EPN60_13380 [Nevskiaceae bacterium]|nr:MAG: hypothetical protein EPO48_11550 [Nevskiaceae bacterium]TAM24687.1 MAG: hypothetical protein EPN60_13380 [Nevskiaceae bacterium]
MPDRRDPPIPPWKKPTPKSSKPVSKLSPLARAAAEARAKAAGRRYPNLVDNLWAARQTFEEAGSADFPPDPPEF